MWCSSLCVVGDNLGLWSIGRCISLWWCSALQQTFVDVVASNNLNCGILSCSECLGIYIALYDSYLRGRIKAGTHGLSAVERAYGRLWCMADRTWQIEHRGEFRLALRRDHLK